MQPFHASSSESSRTWLEATTCSTLHTLEDSQPQVHQPLVGPIMKHPLQDKDLQKTIQQFLTQKHSCANGHENMTNLLQAWACFGKSSAIPGLKKSPSCNHGHRSLDRWKIPWTFGSDSKVPLVNAIISLPVRSTTRPLKPYLLQRAASKMPCPPPKSTTWAVGTCPKNGHQHGTYM